MAGFKSLLWALAFVVIVVGTYADKDITVAGITTKVKGQSGKIAVYKASEGADSGVTITYDAIKEVTAAGEDINSHTFNNFAKMDFTFSDVTAGNYMSSSVNASMFSFMANMTVDGVMATLTSYIYVFRERGNITIDGEDFMVTPGLMKFNVKVEDWAFCNTCKNKGDQSVSGEYLDVYIEIKAKQSPQKGNKNGTYELGDGAMMTVPKEVSLILMLFYSLARS